MGGLELKGQGEKAAQYQADQELMAFLGTLVGQYSELKGKLSQVNERLQRTQEAYLYMAQNFHTAYVDSGRVMVKCTHPMAGSANGLLDEKQLAQVLMEREQLERRIKVLGDKLKDLVPYLF